MRPNENATDVPARHAPPEDTQSQHAADPVAHFIDNARRRPILDERSSDEILGYGDDGLPS